MKKYINIVYPQWQGGGLDTSTYYGAKEIEELYLKEANYKIVPVSIEPKLIEMNDILGYEIILNQLSSAKEIIRANQPDSIFTIGGGCDADIPAIAYLNERYEGDLVVLWFDAHADMNTPKESLSKNFYGMPFRTLLGEGDQEIVKLIPRKLDFRQVVLLGVRELDRIEEAFVNANNIPVISVEKMERNPEVIIEEIEKIGKKNIYIHIDLDVLEPTEFPHVPVPSSDGVKIKTFLRILKLLRFTGSVVGMGLYEYKPSQMKNDLLSAIMEMGLNL